MGIGKIGAYIGGAALLGAAFIGGPIYHNSRVKDLTEQLNNQKAAQIQVQKNFANHQSTYPLSRFASCEKPDEVIATLANTEIALYAVPAAIDYLEQNGTPLLGPKSTFNVQDAIETAMQSAPHAEYANADEASRLLDDLDAYRQLDGVYASHAEKLKAAEVALNDTAKKLTNTRAALTRCQEGQASQGSATHKVSVVKPSNAIPSADYADAKVAYDSAMTNCSEFVYTMQKGDTLGALGSALGRDWHSFDVGNVPVNRIPIGYKVTISADPAKCKSASAAAPKVTSVEDCLRDQGFTLAELNKDITVFQENYHADNDEFNALSGKLEVKQKTFDGTKPFWSQLEQRVTVHAADVQHTLDTVADCPGSMTERLDAIDRKYDALLADIQSALQKINGATDKKSRRAVVEDIRSYTAPDVTCILPSAGASVADNLLIGPKPKKVRPLSSWSVQPVPGYNLAVPTVLIADKRALVGYVGGDQNVSVKYMGGDEVRLGKHGKEQRGKKAIMSMDERIDMAAVDKNHKHDFARIDLRAPRHPGKKIMPGFRDADINPNHRIIFDATGAPVGQLISFRGIHPWQIAAKHLPAVAVGHIMGTSGGGVNAPGPFHGGDMNP